MRVGVWFIYGSEDEMTRFVMAAFLEGITDLKLDDWYPTSDPKHTHAVDIERHKDNARLRDLAFLLGGHK